jgi:hypothetical protein
MARAGEDRIASGVLSIANDHPKGICSYKRARAEIPSRVNLTAGDLAPSQTRRGEPMWHQIVRNIKSHHEVEGNYIQRGLLEHVPKVGYRITDAGRATFKKKP